MWVRSLFSLWPLYENSFDPNGGCPLCQCQQIHPVKSSTSLPLSWVSWHRWLNSHSMGLAYSERQSHPLPYVSNWVCSFLHPDLRNNAYFGSILISQGLGLLSFHMYCQNTHTLDYGRQTVWASIRWSVRLELDNNQNTSPLGHAGSVPCFHLLLCVHHWALSCLHLKDRKWIAKVHIQLLDEKAAAESGIIRWRLKINLK